MAECLFQLGMPPPRPALVAAAHRNSVQHVALGPGLHSLPGKRGGSLGVRQLRFVGSFKVDVEVCVCVGGVVSCGIREAVKPGESCGPLFPVMAFESQLFVGAWD